VLHQSGLLLSATSWVLFGKSLGWRDMEVSCGGTPKSSLELSIVNGKLMVWGAHKCSYFRKPPFFVSKHDTVIVVPIPYWAAKVFSPQNPTVNCFDVLANVLGLTTKISLPASKPTKQKWVG